MSEIAANFAKVRERIAAACTDAGRDHDAVELLAVSKYSTADAVRSALAIGQRKFGESRVQELLAKADALKPEPDLEWHLIGPLQTNKVRDLARINNLGLVHSVDRLRLADELQREFASAGRELRVLLQVNESGEEQKHGCRPDAVLELIDHVQARCTSLRVCGLMAMGPLQGDPRPVFDRVTSLCDVLRARSGLALETLSLGMSGDLEAAVGAGSTMLRIGSALFGERD